MKINNRISILHISEIDNDVSKGTSVIIPQYILSQKNTGHNVGLLNCNNINLSKLNKLDNIFSKSDNKNFMVLKEFKPDIVIFHEVYKPAYIKIYKFCLKNHIPYIVIPHGCLTKEAQNHKRLKKVIGNFLLFNNFLKNAKFIQYLNKNEYKMSTFKNINYFIMGNGVDGIPTSNMFLKTKKDDNIFNIIYVGRYDYLIKGLDQLILACSLIKKEMINKKIRLNLYGIGNEYSRNKILNAILDNTLDDLVIFNGPVYGSKKRKLIAKNNEFIQVSRTEGQPLGVMEAMSLGMPMIISNGTGFSRIVKNNKCGLVTDCSAKRISEAILEIYDMKHKLNDLSENSYTYAKKNFSWKCIANLCIDKYTSIIKEK